MCNALPFVVIFIDATITLLPTDDVVEGNLTIVCVVLASQHANAVDFDLVVDITIASETASKLQSPFLTININICLHF